MRKRNKKHQEEKKHREHKKAQEERMKIQYNKQLKDRQEQAVRERKREHL